MVQVLASVSDHDSAPQPTIEAVSVASTELNSLLLRCSELSKAIARMRKLVKRLAQNADSRRLRGRLREERCSTKPSSSPDHRQRPIARNTLRRSPTNAGSARPVRSKLGRACLIALMEANEPASVETIYDRIERRGSFTFAGYKHPFRAIVLAISAMVKQGEASLLDEEGRRRWRWESERAPSEQPPPFTLA